MVKKGLLSEFMYEAGNTRKLLNAIPNAALDHRSQPHLWSVAELASHIAEIYNFFPYTFQEDQLNMDVYRYDRGDLSRTENIVAKFEANFQKAKLAVEASDEESYFTPWQMTGGGKVLVGPEPRIVMIRSFLFNHLYHHRGELVAQLRATGSRVPGLYGPTYEDMHS